MKLPGMRQYPKIIQVGEQDWSIKFVRSLDGAVGLCCPDIHTIMILMGQSRYETLLTFVHEILHSLEDRHGIDLTEKVVAKLEVGITEFILDNFPLFLPDRKGGKRGQPD